MACTNCASGKGGTPAGCKNNGHCATGGCNKLPVFDWLAGVPLAGDRAPFDGVEVRFKNTRKSFYRSSPGQQLLPGDLVTVDAAPGHDVGMVSLTGELVRAQMQRKTGKSDTFELRKVLRRSTQEDIDRWHEARKQEDEIMFAARRVCQDMGLDMKVSDVEFQGDGTKATFYYTSEQRIDFRDLVRRLAEKSRTKVEMKQIGSRQEAGRIGGIGSCGRELCCSTWLTDLRSVTTSAARYQQLALNPQKLAGQCGKLKCCLNYELDMYIEAIKSYPSQNAKLRTQQGTGVHMKTDIFEEKMWYLFKKPGYASVMAGFPIETVRGILAENKNGVEPEVDLHMVDEPAEAVVKAPEYENVGGEEDLTRFDSMIKTGKKRGRGGKDRRGGEQRKGPDPARQPRQAAGPRPQGGDGGPRPEGSAQAGPQRPRPEGQGRNRERRRGGRDRGPRPDNRPQPDAGPKPPAA
jgi:cell fate regulator YaaT (PSP1 superfamily)